MINLKSLDGKAAGMMVADIAGLHRVPVKQIEEQIRKGIKIEMEHTNDEREAEVIAMDHLVEIPDYYDRLIKMEKEAGIKDAKMKDSSQDDKKYLRYLLRKEKVAPLDKQERMELQQLIQQYGKPNIRL